MISIKSYSRVKLFLIYPVLYELKKKVEKIVRNYPYINEFKMNLVEWFLREKRDLPWRHTKDPYKIWVSEVMLQQTRVDTVIPYYNRFIKVYPTLEHLATAPEEQLLKYWEGLGYYSRVRNLQAGVKEVVADYGSVVPKTRAEISRLKGVGPYTAGAILSIAYGVPEHAVDGNVMRVLSRVLNIDADIALPKTKKIFESAVMMLIDSDNPSAFNQGLMELGALICTPTSPKCLLCPVREQCIAFEEGNQQNLPVKSKKIKTKNVHYKVIVAVDKRGYYLVEKRSETGLLANMWQFPMFEEENIENAIKKFSENYNVSLQEGYLPLMQYKHIFSHLVWHLDVYLLDVNDFNDCSSNQKKYVQLKELDQLPMPVPMLKIKNLFKEKNQNA